MGGTPNDTMSPNAADVEILESLESAVRLYCRKFPTVFTRATGARLHDEQGRSYLDFFCGAGSLNYGHNHPDIMRSLIDHLAAHGVLQVLDMHTTAKRDFVTALHDIILAPRGLDYRVQFCGPTGTDAVEAALKAARKATGRRTVIAFGGGFHGMSTGSLAASGNGRARAAAGGALPRDVVFVPYEDGPSGPFDSISYLDRLLSDPSSGVDLPAAVIFEPLQMDGGVYPASAEWLRGLRDLTERYEIPLIADEIQAGCGRTGRFFAFEHAGIRPDIVTLSKSISGSGLPLAVVLLRPDLDVWEPGEHTGTFRSNQAAMVTGTAAARLWADPAFSDRFAPNVRTLAAFADRLRGRSDGLRVRGRGMVLGIDVSAAGGPERAARIQRRCFTDGLIVESCGRRDDVVKVLPPITIDPSDLACGLDILHNAVRPN